MAEWSSGRTVAECLAELAKVKIAGSPILSPADVMGDAFGLARAFFEKVNYPEVGEVPIVHAPAQLSSGIAPLRRPPLVGEHTNEVLAEFGYSTADIEDLKRQGAI
jgi:crotonobetainyl-CoA:carnitine CoA-transferase CaiB-like acyl-CoA transferase